jgi:hypothetical protein
VRALLALFNLAAHLSAAKSASRDKEHVPRLVRMLARLFFLQQHLCVCILASAKNSWGQKRIIAWQRALVTRRHGRRRGTKVLSSPRAHSILMGEGVLGVIEARRYTAFCLPGQE